MKLRGKTSPVASSFLCWDKGKRRKLSHGGNKDHGGPLDANTSSSLIVALLIMSFEYYST